MLELAGALIICIYATQFWETTWDSPLFNTMYYTTKSYRHVLLLWDGDVLSPELMLCQAMRTWLILRIGITLRISLAYLGKMNDSYSTFSAIENSPLNITSWLSVPNTSLVVVVGGGGQDNISKRRPLHIPLQQSKNN